MPRRCDYCGNILHELPYTCRRCGHHFCSDHHLPENHHCPGHHQRDQMHHHHKYCENCKRELSGMPYKCHRCGMVLCDYCRLPGNHPCKVTHTDTATLWTHKNKIPSDSFWKKLKKQLTLKNFTIVSIVLILVGLMQHISSLNNYQVLFQPIFEIRHFAFHHRIFFVCGKMLGSSTADLCSSDGCSTPAYLFPGDNKNPRFYHERPLLSCYPVWFFCNHRGNSVIPG